MKQIWKSAITLTVILRLTTNSLTAAEAIDSVECKYNEMQVTLSTKDTTLEPIYKDGGKIYLKDKQGVAGCTKAIPAGEKPTTFAIPTTKKECGVEIINLKPDFTSVQAKVVIEANNSTYRVEALAYCLFRSLISATVQGKDGKDTPIEVTDVTVQGGAVGDSPQPQLLFNILKGDQKVDAAELGDKLTFSLALDGDTYSALLPSQCYFSNTPPSEKPDNGAVSLAFIQDGCPLPALNELVGNIKKISPKEYQTEFSAFRFENSEFVYLKCLVKLCVTLADCEKKCPAGKQNDGKGRKKRSEAAVLAGGGGAASEEVVEVSRRIFIGDQQADVLRNMPTTTGTDADAVKSGQVCMANAEYVGVLLALGVLVCFLLLSLLVILCLICRVRSWHRKFSEPTDYRYYVHSSRSASSGATVVPTTTSSLVQIPRAHYPPANRA